MLTLGSICPGKSSEWQRSPDPIEGYDDTVLEPIMIDIEPPIPLNTRQHFPPLLSRKRYSTRHQSRKLPARATFSTRSPMNPASSCISKASVNTCPEEHRAYMKRPTHPNLIPMKPWRLRRSPTIRSQPSDAKGSVWVNTTTLAPRFRTRPWAYLSLVNTVSL